MNSTLPLPPTLNMHIVGHCNFACGYCYARFVRAKTFLPREAGFTILREARARGVRRVTFAGGEPTLHKELGAFLRYASELGLVTSLVTNGSLLDREACRRLFPWLRWLVLSCDSPQRATNDTMGRRPKRLTARATVAVEEVVASVHEWNRGRGADDALRLKLNVVVTAQNVHEDPTEWLRGLAPERVKLLQCAIIPGENDDAEWMRCSREDFARYAARTQGLNAEGITVVAETSEDLLDSYAMVDPKGQFRQAHAGGYVESAPIHEVGMDAAWAEVGGCDLARFERRGGNYDDGTPARGLVAPIVALEGLDGSGKSTLVRTLAETLGAQVVRCPLEGTEAERAIADASPPPERRAWYLRAHYAAMARATELVFAGVAVVMDRSFASTLAYGAAERGVVASLADVPGDLPRPDLLLLLEVEEGERVRRIATRERAETEEERQLREDAAFRERVLAGYRALGAVSLDATRGAEEVLREAIRGVVGG
jgi:radical S-adenosyl methionine domain-containing protein 2